MRNNVRTEQRGDGESVCFRKQDDSWVSSAVRARKQQSWRATWLWGKGTGPGCHILPQSDLASWLDVAMRSPEGTRTHAARPGLAGPTAWCRRRRPRVPITRIPWLPGPPVRQGQGHRRKVCGTRSGVVALPCKGGGGPIPAPRRRPLRPVAWRHNALMRSGRPFCRARNGAWPLNPPRRRHPLRTSNVGIGTTTASSAETLWSEYSVLPAPCSVHTAVLCGPIGGGPDGNRFV